MKNITLFFFLLSVANIHAQNGGLCFHQDNKHAGIYSVADEGSLGDFQWKYKTGGKIFASPLLHDGVVYIGSEDKNFYAIDVKDHQLKWKFTTGGAIYSSAAVFGNTVFFGSYDGFFYAMDVLTKKLKWKFRTNGEKRVGAKGLWTMKPSAQYMEDPYDFFQSSPVIDERTHLVYFGSGDGNLYALNTENGALTWKFKTNGIVHTSPALDGHAVYIGSWDKYFYALDARTGKEKWKFKTGDDTTYHILEGIQSSATVYDGLVYFGSRDGYYYALDTGTGNLVWKYSANGSWILTTGAAKDSTIYIGTSDTYRMIALDAKTGKEKYYVQANGYVYASPAIAGNTLFFGDFTGQLFSIDIHSNGKITGKFQTDSRKHNAQKVLPDGKIDFKFLAQGLDLSLYSSTIAGMNKLYMLGPILSSPVIANGMVYFGSADSCVYALKLKN